MRFSGCPLIFKQTYRRMSSQYLWCTEPEGLIELPERRIWESDRYSCATQFCQTSEIYWCTYKNCCSCAISEGCVNHRQFLKSGLCSKELRLHVFSCPLGKISRILKPPQLRNPFQVRCLFWSRVLTIAAYAMQYSSRGIPSPVLWNETWWRRHGKLVKVDGKANL